jgi:predicted Rossmann-fold nucleotide-binding protein
MTYKIGVYGSGITENQQAIQAARELGYALAQSKVIVITGGGSGMPSIVAQAAKQQGAEIWGFTPARDVSEQQQSYPSDDIHLYNKLFFIPPAYDRAFFLDEQFSASRDRSTRLKYRNFLSTTHADAGIIVAGGWGTMNEFTNLLYDGKPIGVLLGTGGLADELTEWYPRLRKKSESTIHFHHAPMDLVAALLQDF